MWASRSAASAAEAAYQKSYLRHLQTLTSYSASSHGHVTARNCRACGPCAPTTCTSSGRVTLARLFELKHNRHLSPASAGHSVEHHRLISARRQLTVLPGLDRSALVERKHSHHAVVIVYRGPRLCRRYRPTRRSAGRVKRNCSRWSDSRRRFQAVRRGAWGRGCSGRVMTRSALTPRALGRGLWEENTKAGWKQAMRGRLLSTPVVCFDFFVLFDRSQSQPLLCRCLLTKGGLRGCRLPEHPHNDEDRVNPAAIS